MALPLTELDKFQLLHALGLPEVRDRVQALLDLAGTGNMTGPASSTDNALVRYDGTTGALVQNSGVTLSDSNALSGVLDISLIGRMFVGDGTESSPSISFANDTDVGFYRVGNNSLGLSINGTQSTLFNPTFTYSAVQLQGADGSASLPQYSFNSDADTGMFRSGTNAIGFASNGTTVGQFSATSQFLIGSDASPFVIKNAAGDSSGLKLSAGVSGPRIIHHFNETLSIGTNNTVYQTISGAGSITLGASGSSTTHFIHANGIQLAHSSSTGEFQLAKNNSTSSLSICGDSGNAGGEIEVFGSLHASAPNQIRFFNNGILGGLLNTDSQWRLGASGGTQQHIINGNFVSTNAQAASVEWQFYKDVNAGDTANIAQLRVGNSGSNQGSLRLSYNNAAAAGAPSASFAFDPRNNANTTNFNAARLLFSKVAASDNGTAEIQVASGGSLGSYLTVNPNYIGMHTGGSSDVALTISGTSLTGTTQYVTVGTTRFNSTATTAGVVFEAEARTENASFTMNRLLSFNAATINKGASNTIDRTINYGGALQTAGSSNAFISDNLTFVGDYFIHSTSTRASLLSGNTSIIGNVGVGATAATNTKLYIGGTGSVAASNWAFYTDMVGGPSATSVIRGVVSLVTTGAATSTAEVTQFRVENPTKFAGSTITRAIAYGGSQQTQGTNNAYIADNESFTGDYFINSTTTRPSLLGGQLQLGVGSNAAPSYAFSGDTTKGMYSGGTNILSFAVAGTERANIGPTGAWTSTATVTDTHTFSGHSLLLPRVTTTERDAIAGVNGMIIYNTTTAKLQGYAGGAWVDLH